MRRSGDPAWCLAGGELCTVQSGGPQWYQAGLCGAERGNLVMICCQQQSRAMGAKKNSVSVVYLKHFVSLSVVFFMHSLFDVLFLGAATGAVMHTHSHTDPSEWKAVCS